jgi:hypothetical protein
MSKQIETKLTTNFIQFIVLFMLLLSIIIDKIPLLVDNYNGEKNIRLIDGWGDGMINMFYCFIVFVILLTMKNKNNHNDYILVLILAGVTFLSISNTILIYYICVTYYIFFNIYALYILITRK